MWQMTASVNFMTVTPSRGFLRLAYCACVNDEDIKIAAQQHGTLQ